MTFIVSTAAPVLSAPVISVGTVMPTSVQINLVTPSTGASVANYVLQVGLGSTFTVPAFTYVQPASAFPFTVTSLASGTAYSFRMLGVDNAQNTYVSPNSAVVTATTGSTVTVPGQVTGLTVTNVTSTTDLLTWNLDTGASSYTISRVGGIVPSAFYVATSGSDSNAGTLAAPFLTLTKAQSAMQASGTIKTCYLRAGTYTPASTLTLLAADNGETWSYYPPDGYNSAIVNCQATGPTNGINAVMIDGASNVTWNGIKFINVQQFAFGVHGGPAEPNMFSPNTVANVTGTTITNCFFDTSFANARENVFPLSCIWQIGNVQNSTYSNNVCQNLYGAAFMIADKDGATNQGQTYTGLLIENNAILNVNITHGDSGAIYLVNRFHNVSTGTVTNNFIRDYQNTSSDSGTDGDSTLRDVGIYCDEGAYGITITYNVIANTAHVLLASGSAPSTFAFYTNSGSNMTWKGNIVDLGTTAFLGNLNYEWNSSQFPGNMPNNVFQNNIFIGNWTGTQQSYGSGNGPFAYPSTNNGGTNIAFSGNYYWNYGSGSLSTSGTQQNDSTGVTNVNPLISGTTYTLSASTPVVGFPGIPGGWGPPGYAIPSTGTAPCYG